MGSRSRIAISIVILAVGGIAAGLVATIWLSRPSRIVMQGAVMKRDADVEKQSPIANVQIRVEGARPPIVTKSDFSGFFKIELPFGARRGESVVLQFRHADYLPLNVPEIIGGQLYVIGMTPVPKRAIAPPGPTISLSNIRIRYSTRTESEVNIGSEVTTFIVKNQPNVRCDRTGPCSPDGNWRASIGSASLDAGDGNVFEDARVSCMAGPCPFTKIVANHYSRVSRTISVSVLDWSSAATFLMQAEVVRRSIGSSVRQLYPVIFGDSINFSLPPPAEGQTVEAEVNSVETVFPLGPSPELPWAECNVQVDKNQSKSYRCELKPGYQIAAH